MLGALATAVGGGLAPAWLIAPRARAAAAAERVIQLTDGRIWAGPGWTDADLDAGVLRSVVEQALCELTSASNATAALAALIPEVSNPDQRYAIKVNCVNADLPTHPRVVGALVDLLLEAGARADRIAVFDRADHELLGCGYAPGQGERYAVTGTLQTGPGYDPAVIELSDGTVRLSRIITAQADHIINIPVLKNHSMAGVTLSLKNHFGSIDDPEVLHGRQNDGCPGIAELNAQQAVRDKTRLVLVDATFGNYRSGLAGKPDFAPMPLIAAANPLAADRVGQRLINQQREKEGREPIDARHLRLAADLGLGPASLSEVAVASSVLHPVEKKARPWDREDKGGCTVAPESGSRLPAAVAAGAAALWYARRRGARESAPSSPGDENRAGQKRGQ